MKSAEQLGVTEEVRSCRKTFENYLDTHDIPDPDLLIRTSGKELMLHKVGAIFQRRAGNCKNRAADMRTFSALKQDVIILSYAHDTNRKPGVR